MSELPDLPDLVEPVTVWCVLVKKNGHVPEVNLFEAKDDAFSFFAKVAWPTTDPSAPFIEYVLTPRQVSVTPATIEATP